MDNKKEVARRIGDATQLIAFSPDGRNLISTHADLSLVIWDVKTRRPIWQKSEIPKPVSSLAAFPDGRHVLIGLWGPAFVWDLGTNRRLRKAPGVGVSIALTADGRRALIGGGNEMRLWDLETGDQLERGDHKAAVKHVAFSSDERQAVSITDERIHVWALPSGRAAGDQPPVVWEQDFLCDEGIMDSVAVSHDGKWVLTGGCFPDSARVWDRETGQLVHEFHRGGKRMWSVAFSPIKRTVALTGGEDSVVRLWDLESGAHRELVGHREIVMSVAFSPDGSRAYSAGGLLPGFKNGTDFAVRVWDLKSWQPLTTFEGHTAAVWSLAVSPDGKYVLSAGNDAVPILWEATTGRARHRFVGHVGTVHAVAFLPDCQHAVSAGDDATIRLWDIDTGREVPDHFKDPPGGNEWLAVSPDGTRLVTAGQNKVRYWNLDTGKLLQTLKWEEGSTSGSFTPDGRRIVWGGWNGILRMYRLTDVPDPPTARTRRSPNLAKRPGSPIDATPHTNRGESLKHTGKLPESIAQYRETVRVKPDYALAHQNLAEALRAQGLLAEAIIEFKKAIALNPKPVDAHTGLAKALTAENKLEAAIAEFHIAIGLGADAADAHDRLGFAMRLQGNLEAAIAEHKKATELSPENACYLNNLAWTLVIRPKRPRPEYDEGLKHAHQAVDLEPDYVHQSTLALAEYRKGHWAWSLAASERAMEQNNGGNAWDWFLMAMAHCQKGDKEEARNWFDKAVAWTEANAPENPDLRQFRSEAAELLGLPGTKPSKEPSARAREPTKPS